LNRFVTNVMHFEVGFQAHGFRVHFMRKMENWQKLKK